MWSGLWTDIKNIRWTFGDIPSIFTHNMQVWRMIFQKSEGEDCILKSAFDIVDLKV